MEWLGSGWNLESGGWRRGAEVRRCRGEADGNVYRFALGMPKMEPQDVTPLTKMMTRAVFVRNDAGPGWPGREPSFSRRGNSSPFQSYLVFPVSAFLRRVPSVLGKRLETTSIQGQTPPIVKGEFEEF